MRELNDIRAQIDGLDKTMRELFVQRMTLALEVAHSKEQSGDNSIYRPERETAMLDGLSAGLDERFRQKYVSLLQNIICASRECQYSERLRLHPECFPFHPVEQPLTPKNVYYQGVPGAYQELAARALFPDLEPKYLPTWIEVFQYVRDGKADVGVVPVENSTAGTVSEVYDLMLEYDLFINRCYIKKISHCLAGVPGSTLDAVRCVLSHPHALPQCYGFINEHRFAMREVANTAMAAQQVRESGEPTLAAICSREAAERYGLAILAEGINDIKHNETRFIAVSRTMTSMPEDTRMEIAFHIPNIPGSLDGVVGIFADYGIDMTNIYSRPLKDSLWCYVFYIDFIGNMRDNKIQSLLYQLHEELPYIKIIGSY